MKKKYNLAELNYILFEAYHDLQMAEQNHLGDTSKGANKITEFQNLIRQLEAKRDSLLNKPPLIYSGFWTSPNKKELENLKTSPDINASTPLVPKKTQ